MLLYYKTQYGMLQEFMDFMLKNNVIGVAIWLLIATKVGEVVKSLIEDLLTPLLLAPLFKKMKVDKLEELSVRGVLYGQLLARIIEFVVIAIIVFIMIKYMGLKTP